MEMMGLDLHKRESQLCILTHTGELVERRIITAGERAARRRERAADRARPDRSGRASIAHGAGRGAEHSDGFRRRAG